MTTTKACYRCGSENDTKPWGPGRSQICADCACSDPELEAISRMYWQKDAENRRNEMVAKLKKDNPGVDFVAIPLGLLETLNMLASLSEACDCPECTKTRKEDALHVN